MFKKQLKKIDNELKTTKIDNKVKIKTLKGLSTEDYLPKKIKLFGIEEVQ